MYVLETGKVKLKTGKNNNFNPKEPDPAPCMSWEFRGSAESCQCSGNTGFRLVGVYFNSFVSENTH